MPRKVLTLLAERKAAAASSWKPAGGWVPVAERLPEKFTEVLIAFAGQARLQATGYTGSLHDKNGWCYRPKTTESVTTGSDPAVTHWMHRCPMCRKPANV